MVETTFFGNQAAWNHWWIWSVKHWPPNRPSTSNLEIFYIIEVPKCQMYFSFACLRRSRKAWWRHALQNQNTWAWISSTYLWLFQNINIPVGTCLTCETYFHCPSAGKTQEFQLEIRTMAPLKSLPAQVKIHGTVPPLEHVIGTWINMGHLQDNPVARESFHSEPWKEGSYWVQNQLSENASGWTCFWFPTLLEGYQT